MKTLRNGDVGDAVGGLQYLLNELICSGLKADGFFGDKTEEAVENFQKLNDLLMDGVAGTATWNKIVELKAQSVAPLSIVKIDVDEYEPGGGYKHFNLREDAADSFQNVVDEVHDKGGIITSSGSLRPLFMPVSANRSATSMHYTGLAIDLNIWSGMVDPKKDPYVCVRSKEDDRKFEVYARCPDGPRLELEAYTYENNTVKVQGNFIDLTQLMAEHGFHPIRARRSFFKGSNRLGAEWWHFQYERAFASIDPFELFFFGVELAKTNKLDPESPPYEYRSRAFGYDWH